MKRPHVDVPAVLDALGIEAHRSGTELRSHCPNPTHAKRPGPGSWQIDPKTGLHTCYACGFGGGVVALVQVVAGVDREGAIHWLRERVGFVIPKSVRPADFPRKVAAAPALRYPKGTVALWRQVPADLEPARTYLFGRGLTERDLRDYAIGAVPEEAPTYSGRVIVPVVVGNRMVDFVARLYVPRPSSTPKALSGRRDLGALKEFALWGYDRTDPTIPRVYVVEGVWGAIAMLRAGIPNVVAACGSAWSYERTDLLARRFSEVVLVPDGDAAGSKLVDRAAPQLGARCDVRVVDLGAGKQPDDLTPVELVRAVRTARVPRLSASALAVVRPFTRKSV